MSAVRPKKNADRVLSEIIVIETASSREKKFIGLLDFNASSRCKYFIRNTCIHSMYIFLKYHYLFYVIHIKNTYCTNIGLNNNKPAFCQRYGISKVYGTRNPSNDIIMAGGKQIKIELAHSAHHVIGCTNVIVYCS